MTNKLDKAFISLGSLNGYLSRMDGQQQIPREDFVIIVEWLQNIREALNSKFEIIEKQNDK